MEQERSDPDELLRMIRKDEERMNKGRLKVFLGYSAGVGKTYSMLSDAHIAKRAGRDVVVGYVETHGRTETDLLLNGLDSVPPIELQHAGIRVKELDIDGLLKRRPEVALIDELAHTNAAGARHSKRYQDVLELLDNGIDVYSTLNIQHLESLNDTIKQITGIQVHETVPDSIIDEAEIKIVDLPPEELIQRLKDGKVYIPERAAVALENFFNEGNLIALRELVLRRGAERVDVDMRDYMEHRSIPGPWGASDRLLVCIGHNQKLTEKLIRRTRRLADEMRVDWYAIYVDTPASNRLLPKIREGVATSLDLAESLGAHVHTTFGVSEAEEVVRFAKKNNITRIIVGRQVRKRWREILSLSFVDRLIRISGAIEVYIITDDVPREKVQENILSTVHIGQRYFFYCAWMVLFVSIISVLIENIIDVTNIIMLYLLAVVVSSMVFGLVPAILTSAFSVLAFDYFFVPPRLTFSVSDSQYLISFIAFFVVSVVISYLMVRTKEYALSAQKRESSTLALYALSQGLTITVDEKEVGDKVVQSIKDIFNWGSVVVVKESGSFIVLAASSDITMTEKEMAVAIWAYNNESVAGFQTETLRNAGLRYIPMKTGLGMVGVLGVRPDLMKEGYISPEQERILQVYADQAALAIDRIQMARALSNRKF